jgi:hypothetical protein
MSDFENDLQRLTFLKRTIALLSSMVDSGERHTTRSKEMKNNAQQVIIEMEANVVKTSTSKCNIPLVSNNEVAVCRCKKVTEVKISRGGKPWCFTCGKMLRQTDY